MASRAQVEANRRNAQLSTGPRSAAGKSRSAMNALKHGVTAEKATLPAEDRAAHERLREDLFARLAPVGELEARLVDRLALLYARLDRAALADTAAWNAHWQEDVWPKEPQFGPAPGGLDHLTIGVSAALRGGVLKQLNLIAGYEARLGRAIEAVRAELAALQQQRREAEAMLCESREEAIAAWQAAGVDRAVALLAHFEAVELAPEAAPPAAPEGAVFTRPAAPETPVRAAA
jgi:hypothetical protein